MWEVSGVRVALRLWSLERLFVLIDVSDVYLVCGAYIVVGDVAQYCVRLKAVFGEQGNVLPTDTYLYCTEVREDIDLCCYVFCTYIMKGYACHTCCAGV